MPAGDLSCRRGELFVDRYVLGDVIGAGGMGIVFAATQRSLGRPVAIKLLRPDSVGDPVARDRFHNEALAGSRVDHQNVARVLDFGIDRGAPYLVMEHIVGPRLGELLLDHGPMPTGAAIDMVRQIVAGLENIHNRGIIHADVKSDNILVETRDGVLVPRLIDFGIARFVDGSDNLPDDVISGTPAYLAPEVIRGGAPTFASDIYAVGVILYELITGSTPFAGDSAQIMNNKLEVDAVPMTWRCPELDIPPDLDGLVARAIAREPEQRFRNAAALGQALDTVTRGDRRSRRPTPVVFTAEETTATFDVEPSRRRPPVACSPIEASRVAVLAAMTAGDVDQIARGYLDLARALIDEHRIAAAVTELQEGVELLTLPNGKGPVWRLLLTLAALYDGNNDRSRARLAAIAARDQARVAGSKTGSERAEQLCARLARRRSSTHRSRPW